MPNYYPIMLDVRSRPAVVIGGDAVAAEKAAALCACGARVTVISPTFCQQLQREGEQGRVTLRRKAYERGDMAGAFVVVAATSDPGLVEEIWAETQESGQLVNIVDVPARCTFILPSILRRDQLTIAVSTEGASPSLAKRIRQHLESSRASGIADGASRAMGSPGAVVAQMPHCSGPAQDANDQPRATAYRLPPTVYLVGAGPGDPDLITVKGLRCLRRADVVVYD